MSETQANGSQPADHDGPCDTSRMVRSDSADLYLAFAILACGLAIQSLTFLNHDVAWVLYSSRELLSGAVFGEDVVAANPPLIWWISLIPNLFSEQTGLPIIGVYRGFVFAASLVSILTIRQLLYPTQNPNPPKLVVLTCAAWLLAFAIHRDYGQREHLAIILTLPYIAAITRRVEALPLGQVSALIIGVTAGVGFALKPYFVFVPLLLEGWLLWRARNLRLLFRPEAIGAILSVVAYGAAILIFAPNWLFETAPEIRKVYWAFENGVRWWRLANLFALPVILCCWTLARSRTNLGIAMFLGAIGFLFAAIVQGKLYTYHLYPAYMLMVLAGFSGALQKDSARAGLTAALMGAVLLHSGAIAYSNISARTAGGATGRSIQSVADFVRQQVPAEGSFISISTHPFPGFPTALYAERRWGSRSNSRIYLPAVVKLDEIGAEEDKELRDYVEARSVAELATDLEQRPDLILVDINPIRHAIGGSDFDFLKLYLQHERTRRLLSEYRRLDRAPSGYAAYVSASRDSVVGSAGE